MAESATETLVDRLYHYARVRSDAPALIDASETITWKELGATTNRIANALLRSGLRKGERVALVADTSVRTASIILGVLKAGGSAVPVPTLISTDAIARVIEDCGARHLFVSANCRTQIQDCDLSTVACFATDFVADGRETLETFLHASSDAPPSVRVALEDEFNIIYSSGTTGRPKGIVHDHALRADSSVELEPISFPDGARTVTTTALYSNWTMGALIYTLWAGGCVRFLGKFSAPELVRVCDEFKPHNVYLVPVQIGRVLADENASAALHSLAPAMKWTAGSYLSLAWKQKLVESWPGGLIEIYGMTEGTPFTILRGHERPDKLHTVGQSDPPEDIKIIDDDGNELPFGQRGEIVGRVRKVMLGYNNNAAATQALFWHDKSGTPYFRSGDIGILDEEYFLQVTDRKKDMIISGGFNIYASDLEEVLLSHPAVSEAAVFGLPSNVWGETPAAAVVLKSSARTEEKVLLAWANKRLGKLQRLSVLVLADALPRGSLDKVLKRELRATYAHLGDAA
jgi:acyl-CoA synthetase (AMP-forming)/AMP-acid ligase II